MHGTSISVILIAAAGVFIAIFIPMMGGESLMNIYSRSAWGVIGLAVFWLAMLYDYRTEFIGTVVFVRPGTVSTQSLKLPDLPAATVVVPFVLAAVALVMTFWARRNGVFTIVSWMAAAAAAALDGVAAATFGYENSKWMAYVRIMAFVALAAMILAVIFAGPKSGNFRR